MNRDGEGFENEIAAIIADELGADLTYEWWPQAETMLSRVLAEGACDVIMGVPDGFEELLTTVAYYSSPYVFVQSSAAPIKIETLEDPRLADLRIGVQSEGIPPQDALIGRGLSDALVSIPGRQEPLTTVLDDVLAGRIDLGIAWGPVAGDYVKRTGADLVLTPVSPQFEMPFLSMVVPMVMAVRPGDVALRDQLNLAITARWHDIERVLDSFGVPLEPASAPIISGGLPAELLRVGVVVPNYTKLGARVASVNEVAGEAAYRGALLAEAEVNRDQVTIDLELASAPSLDAAVRAARRLLVLNRVDVLVGGIGEGQAELIAAEAAGRRAIFMNVGSSSPELRSECSLLAFHVEPSAEMYSSALLSAFSGDTSVRYFAVVEDTSATQATFDVLVEILDSLEGAELVGSAFVSPDQPTYLLELEQAKREGAEVVLALLGPRDEIAFLSQHHTSGSTAIVAAFPNPVNQTRDFLAAERYQAGNFDPRVTAWDASLRSPGAIELNDHYASRFGTAMDPSAWTVFTAVSLTASAATSLAPEVRANARREGTMAALIAHALRRPGVLNVRKESGAWFANNGQLRQSIYRVVIDEDVAYSTTAAELAALARVVDIMPAAVLTPERITDCRVSLP